MRCAICKDLGFKTLQLRSAESRYHRRRFMLADLAARLDDRVGDTTRVAGAWVDDRESVAEATAMGAFCFIYE
jgi:hypothetical protein